jgi:hypothetical protein
MRMLRCAVTVVVGLSATVTAQTTQTPPAALLVEKLGAYLTGYEPELSAIVAEEVLTQRIPPGRVGAVRRVLQSDVAFLRLPGDGPWIGYREVKRVDEGDTRAGGPRLLALLARPGQDSQQLAVKLAWDSARHNLGSPRTINMPGLILELMHSRHHRRFKFTVGKATTFDGTAVVRLGFNEIARPSIIRSPDGSDDMVSHGWAYIEPATGRLWKGDVRVRHAGSMRRPVLETRVEVEFTPHAALGLLVPKRMREEFFVGTAIGYGEAVYRNFRRFSTNARILPQVRARAPAAHLSRLVRREVKSPDARAPQYPLRA